MKNFMLNKALESYFEFIVRDADDCVQAQGTARNYGQALSEGQRYLVQYQQDGPHSLEVRRVDVLFPAGAAPTAEKPRMRSINPTHHLDDLAHLLSWLDEKACQAADAGHSRTAGMLVWAAEVINECIDEDAPDPPAEKERRHPTPVPVLPEDAQVIEPAKRTILVPVPTPVPVTERLPRLEDCDAEGRCWMFGKIKKEWRLIKVKNPGVPQLKYCFSHWLPFYALPLPTEEVTE